MKYLITYVYTANQTINPRYCYDITDDPATWVGEMQEYYDGTYILLNQLPLTPELAEKYKGALKGM